MFIPNMFSWGRRVEHIQNADAIPKNASHQCIPADIRFCEQKAENQRPVPVSV